MKKIIFLLILFFINCNFLCAQRRSEAELLKLVETETGINKLNVLLDLQQSFLYDVKDWYYNGLLLEEAQKQNNVPYTAMALRNRVAYYYREFDSDSIFYYAKIAEDFAEKHKQKRDWFLIKQLIIQRYLEQGHYSLGLKEAMKMNKTAQESNDIQMEATALEFLAKTYHSLGQPQKAINYMKRARHGFINRKDTPYKLLGYHLYMSYFYIDKNDLDSLYLHADSLRVMIDKTALEYPTYNLKDYEIGNNLNFAYYYIQSNRLNEAWKQIEKTDELIEEDKSRYYIYLSDLKKMQYYHAGKDYEKMNHYYAINYEYCEKNQLERGMRYLLRMKAMALGEQGRHDEAVAGYRLLENHVDSINHERFLYEINQLGMEFELDKKEDYIKQQKRELRLKTQLNVVLIILFVLSFAGIIIIVRYLKIIQSKNRHLFHQIRELTETKMELILFKECVKERVGGLATNCSDKDNVLFEKVEDFMNKKKPYINSEYGRKNLIADMNTNEVYLSRAIRKGINMTIQEYLNSWRMEYAKYILLRDMNITVETVAMDSGFSSIRNFYRLFRDAYGMSPAEFRNYVRENYKT